MSSLYYKIKEIPDLTLGKYDYLSENGVDGVLELHNSFLWTLYEKSILSDVSFHLMYAYKKENPAGQKIEMYFIAKGEESKLKNVEVILKSAVISDYFHFCEIKDVKELPVADEPDTFKFCNALCKEEVFFTGGDSRVYYDVPLWKPNESGRLFGMFRMMEQLNENLVFRVDIKAIKKNRSLRRLLSSAGGPIPNLHALQSQQGGERDYGAESILKDYEELLKTLDSTPHFSANAFVFSNNRESGSLVLAAALTEAIKTGDYHISTFQDNFTAEAFLDDRDVRLYDDLDINNRFRLEKDKRGLRLISSALSDSNYENMSYLSNLFTLAELAPIFRLPCLYDGEVINMRKETVAPLVSGDDSIYLGRDENGYEINFPLKLFPKHAFVSGVPGSGKTNTMHHITHSLWKKGIPFLVFEPAKKEYRALCNLEDMKELHLFSPAANTKFPLHINPFEFPKGLSVAEHIRTLCQVFEGAFPLENPMPFLLDNAIESVYREKGWRPETVYTDDLDLEFPTISMLYKKLEDEIGSTTYSGELKGNLESALKVRIGSLLRREMGDVFDVAKSTLPPERWLEVPAVIELEAMGKGPANFLTLMLCSLIRECLKVNPHCQRSVRHVVFIEEAHNLIGPDSEEKTGSEADAKTAATAFIVKMLAEVRALKEAVVIADQLPSVMAQEVIKNTGLKVALRLTAMDDRQLLCNSMSANSSQIEDMGTFKVGEALISYEGLQRPFKMRIHQWCKNEGCITSLPESEQEKALKVLTTPKKDDDLQWMLINNHNEVYMDCISKSCEIYCKKTDAERAQIVERLKQINRFIDAHAKKQGEYDLLEKELAQLCEDAGFLLSKYEGDEEKAATESEEWREYVDKILAYKTHMEKVKDDLSQEEKRINKTFKFFNEIVEFMIDAWQQVLYFKNLGLECTAKDIENLRNDKESLVDKNAQRIYYIRTFFIGELYRELTRTLDLVKDFTQADVEKLKRKIAVFNI